MIVVCLGHVDKRPILYSLMKLLQSFGDVAVVTRNRQLQRLLESKSSSGYFNNIFVAISDAVPEAAILEAGCAPGDFDHIIYDSIDVLPDRYDLCIHSKSFGLMEYESEVLGYKSDIVQYNFVYDGKTEKGCINIPVAFPLIKSVEEFEARKLLIPIQCDVMQKSLSSLTAPQLKITEKDALKILKRKWNEK